MSRLSETALADYAGRLSDRDRRIVETVARLRLLKADQVERLFFTGRATDLSSGRHCRRSLALLAQQGLLRRLDRRVGGVRAGSSGHLYAMAPAGRRLIAQWTGAERPSSRGFHEPGVPFIAHTLAISELYVRLVEANRGGSLDLLGFDAEPVCWRSYTTPVGAAASLKPDALVRVGVGEWEERSFCEVDLGSEGRGALARKLRAYLDYYRCGREQAAHGIFPRVVWVATSQERADLIATVAQEQSLGTPGLFVTTTLERALLALAGRATEEEPR